MKKKTILLFIFLINNKYLRERYFFKIDKNEGF